MVNLSLGRSSTTHKTKFNNKDPNSFYLFSQIRFYIQSIFPSTNKKATKTCHLAQLINLS